MHTFLGAVLLFYDDNLKQPQKGKINCAANFGHFFVNFGVKKKEKENMILR